MKNPLFTSCYAKQEATKALFSGCQTPEEKYKKIIELGQKLAPFDPLWKVEKNLVRGCQSIVYLHGYQKNGLMFFRCSADALISAGLAALLINVYNEEPLEAILYCPPVFLDDLGIRASLSPGRSNGLASIYARMKLIALSQKV